MPFFLKRKPPNGDSPLQTLKKYHRVGPPPMLSSIITVKDPSRIKSNTSLARKTGVGAKTHRSTGFCRYRIDTFETQNYNYRYIYADWYWMILIAKNLSVASETSEQISQQWTGRLAWRFRLLEVRCETEKKNTSGLLSSHHTWPCIPDFPVQICSNLHV